MTRLYRWICFGIWAHFLRQAAKNRAIRLNKILPGKAGFASKAGQNLIPLLSLARKDSRPFGENPYFQRGPADRRGSP
jgi:hypothetical protein